MPGQAFFRVDRQSGARTLHLNTAHRFYEDLYQAPSTTAEFRSALEILLFCYGDVLLDAGEGAQGALLGQVNLWSRRLEQALGMMASHLITSDDEDVGPLEWND